MAIARRKRRKRLLFDPDNFPLLDSGNHRCTSDPIEEHNCISFAAGDRIRFWWPSPDYPLKSPYFWPKSCPLEETVNAFVCAYRIVGFEDCPYNDGERLEEGWERIAIFVANVSDGKGNLHLEPTHAAIQSPSRNGLWRSKMGTDEDIEHRLRDLEGPLYGKVELFMKRSFAARRIAAKMLRQRPESH